MIMPSHYALLTEAADAMAFTGVIGEPTKERKSRGKARARDERGRFIRQQETAIADRRDSAPVVPRAASEELDAAYHETFTALSTTKMEELLLGGNERLDQMLELIGSWWKWEKRQMQTLRAETRKRNRLAEMEELHNKNQQQLANQREAGSGTPLDSMFDSMFGGEDVGGRRKKDARTRRKPTVKKPAFFSRAGAKVMSGLGTVGKAGALAATGALGLLGARSVLADTPEPDADLNNKKVDSKTPDVKRAASVAAEESPDLNRATKQAAQAEKGMFGKLGGLGKVAGVAGSLLTVGLVANEAMDVHNNDTLTDKEKDREYSKLGGTTAGSVVGGAGGAWLGAQGGAAAGAMIGSVVPILGTAVGAAVGTAVGAVLGGGLGSYFGGSAGEEAGTMMYDVVVRDDQVKEEDAHKVQAELKSPDLEKLAKATETQGANQSWWSRLFGGAPAATAGSYSRGTAGYTPGIGYGANRDNVVPRAGAPTQRIDYRADPNYVAGQGVLKNLPISNKQEQRLSQWSSLIEDKASKHGVDPMLVRSVIKQESGGKADAQSGVGATGLMQLMPGTAADVGVRNSWDPDQNVEGGTKYLSQMIKQFDGNVPVALAAYNWGPGNMRKLIRKTGSTDINELMQYMPRETQGYVQNITRSHAAYKEQAAATSSKAEASTVEIDRSAKAQEIPVQRTDTSDNIVTQTTPPPAIAAVPQQKKEDKQRRDRVSPVPAVSRQAPPRALAASGGQDPTSLDDMPLLLTDHGLGSLLTGNI